MSFAVWQGLQSLDLLLQGYSEPAYPTPSVTTIYNSGGWDIRPPMIQIARGSDTILDPIRRQCTFHFGYWPSGLRTQQLALKGDEPGGYCQVTGLYCPGNRLVQRWDGLLVADFMLTDPNPLDQQ